MLKVVLAGGASSRMGQDKAQLVYAGQTLLERSCQLLDDIGVGDCVVSGPQGEPDLFPNLGPLGGILSVLEAHANYAEFLFIPVDTPNLDVDCLSLLLSHGRTHQRACYFYEHYVPFYLPMQSQVLGYLHRQLKEGKHLAVKGLHQACNAQALHLAHENTLFNLNTPQQWQSFIQSH